MPCEHGSGFLGPCGVQASVPDRCAGRDFCARGEPLVVALELQSEPVIEDLQVAVAAAGDRLRHDRQNFLRHDTDVGLVAAVVAEAIEAEAVVEMAKQRDVVLEHHVGSPATAAASAATATADAATTAAADASNAAADAATTTDATHTAADASNANAAAAADAANATAAPAAEADPAAPADSGNEVTAAPVPAGTVPTVVIPAIPAAAPEVLDVVDDVEIVDRGAATHRIA